MATAIAVVNAGSSSIKFSLFEEAGEVFYRDFNDPKYRPAPLLREMVAAGYLGRKSGRGFYSYG